MERRKVHLQKMLADSQDKVERHLAGEQVLEGDEVRYEHSVMFVPAEIFIRSNPGIFCWRTVVLTKILHTNAFFTLNCMHA
jgi:hypothetical protein